MAKPPSHLYQHNSLDTNFSINHVNLRNVECRYLWIPCRAVSSTSSLGEDFGRDMYSLSICDIKRGVLNNLGAEPYFYPFFLKTGPVPTLSFNREFVVDCSRQVSLSTYAWIRTMSEGLEMSIYDCNKPTRMKTKTGRHFSTSQNL